MIDKFVTSGRTLSTLDVRTSRCHVRASGGCQHGLRKCVFAFRVGWVESLARGQVFETKTRAKHECEAPTPCEPTRSRFCERGRESVERCHAQFHDKSLWEGFSCRDQLIFELNFVRGSHS